VLKTHFFEDTLLIPVNAILGCKELAQQKSVQIALTPVALWFQCGSWSLRLILDQHGRFPDIYRVIPAADKLPMIVTLVSGVDAQERNSSSMRSTTLCGLSGIQTTLDGLLVDRPRRNLVRRYPAS
jgi:hypothetical protein